MDERFPVASGKAGSRAPVMGMTVTQVQVILSLTQISSLPILHQLLYIIIRFCYSHNCFLLHW